MLCRSRQALTLRSRGLNNLLCNISKLFRFHRSWGIGESEELDCPGLVKRVGGKLSLRTCDTPLDHFTPLSRIALNPWMRDIGKDALAAVFGWLEQLKLFDLAMPVKKNRMN